MTLVCASHCTSRETHQDILLATLAIHIPPPHCSPPSWSKPSTLTSMSTAFSAGSPCSLGSKAPRGVTSAIRSGHSSASNSQWVSTSPRGKSPVHAMAPKAVHLAPDTLPTSSWTTLPSLSTPTTGSLPAGRGLGCRLFSGLVFLPSPLFRSLTPRVWLELLFQGNFRFP